MGKQFDAIVCDLSAWQYWSTPPAIRKAILPIELARESMPKSPELLASLRVPRKNARRPDALIGSRLLGDLKGVSLPVHVITDSLKTRLVTTLVHPHRMRIDLMDSELYDLGGGLAVTSPEATLRHLARTHTLGFVLEKMFEACGIYSVVPQTARVTATIGLLVKEGLLTRSAIARMPSISAFYDEAGSIVSHTDREGNPLDWKPAIDRSGAITDLWKRPQLVSLDSLRAHTKAAAQIPRARGTARALRAAQQAMEGSGSPLESKAAIMLFTERSIGGEQLTDVKLNHTIALTKKAQVLAHQKTCVADALDSQHELVFEANGEAYHADRHGFAEQSGRRAALETMGYTVMNITNDMLNDLERLDAFLTSIEMQTGIHLREKSVAFLGRREKLHGELFFPHALRTGKHR